MSQNTKNVEPEYKDEGQILNHQLQNTPFMVKFDATVYDRNL